MRIPSGYLNSVNDPSIGNLTAPPFGPSPFAGQLGKQLQFTLGENANANASIGTVLNGTGRYVRLAAGAGTPIIGQIYYWDISVAENLWQVTTAESGSTDAAMFIAGVGLSLSPTPGNYTFIQDSGPVFTKFRATLTAAGAVGSRVYAAASGGADLGFADVIDSTNAAQFGDVSKMIGRFLGIAEDAPTNGGLKRVNLMFKNLRG
jgi:hypothetical protein